MGDFFLVFVSEEALWYLTSYKFFTDAVLIRSIFLWSKTKSIWDDSPPPDSSSIFFFLYLSARVFAVVLETVLDPTAELNLLAEEV